MGNADRRTRREKGQDPNPRYLDDWAFDPHMERLSRNPAGTPCQALHRRTQYPQIQTQPSVQPGDSVHQVAGSKDWLCTFAKARRPASCTTRFAKHALAQYFISWIC